MSKTEVLSERHEKNMKEVNGVFNSKDVVEKPAEKKEEVVKEAKPDWEKEENDKRSKTELDAKIKKTFEDLELGIGNPIDTIIADISNAQGRIKELLQRALDSLRFRQTEIKEREEKQQRNEKEIKMNNNSPSFVDEETNVKKSALILASEVAKAAGSLKELAIGFFDALGNEVAPQEHHKAAIFQVAPEDIKKSADAVSAMHKKLQEYGFKVEVKEYEHGHEGGKKLTATAFAVHLPQGFLADNLMTMSKEDFEKMLKAKEEQKDKTLEISQPNVAIHMFGSMEGQKMAKILAEFSKEIKGISQEIDRDLLGAAEMMKLVLKNDGEHKECTHFRDLHSSRGANAQGRQSFAERFGGGDVAGRDNGRQ